MEKIKIESVMLAASAIFYAIRELQCNKCPFELMCKESGTRNVSVCEEIMSQITGGNLVRLGQPKGGAEEVRE